MYVGKHAAPKFTQRHAFGKKVAAVIVTTAAVGTIVIPAAQASTHATPVSWTEQACHAEAAYAAGEHPAVSLERMIEAVSHLGKSYLKADALQLAADASSPAAKAAYVSDDETYLYEDCNNASGL